MAKSDFNRDSNREREDGPDDAALVVAGQLGQDRVQDGDELPDEADLHVGQRPVDQVVDLRVVLELKAG